MGTNDKGESSNLKDPARQTDDLHQRKSPSETDNMQREAERNKATQFDGDPNVQQAPETPLGPKDDTPWKIPKKG